MPYPPNVLETLTKLLIARLNEFVIHVSYTIQVDNGTSQLIKLLMKKNPELMKHFVSFS